MFGGDADEGGEHQPRHMRVLGCRVKRVGLGARIVVADRSTRLDRVGHQAVVDDVELGDVLGGLEGGVRSGLVAEMPLEDRVVLGFGMQLGRALGLCLCGVCTGGQHLIGDVDRLGAVFGLGKRFGQHHGDIVADIADLALRKGRVATGLHRRAILRMDHPAADQPADLVLREVFAGEDLDHTRHLAGCADIDRLDRGMRMRRAQRNRPGPDPRD